MGFLKASAAPEPDAGPEAERWCVLLVDDEPEVHSVTQLALRGFEFNGRKLELVSAYSAAQARDIFLSRNDIALAMVDVVMETDHAGLDLVRHVRQDRRNALTRLVLRTGQPGQAPEDQVIRDYDIDDYKEKTELTTRKLRTLLYSMLRAYDDLRTIEAQRKGLNNLLEIIPSIHGVRSLEGFAGKVREALFTLLAIEQSSLYCLVVPDENSGVLESRSLVATRERVEYESGLSRDQLPTQTAARLEEALSSLKSKHFDDCYVDYMPGSGQTSNVMEIDYARPLNLLERQLLELFSHNILVAFHGLGLLEDLQSTSRELVYLLGGAVEARSRETGAHVQRVALMSELLANLVGLPDWECEQIRMASPLHDIGKVAIPDAILHKPGKLTPEEWEIMKKHVDYGVEILGNSKRSIMRKAAEIIGYHHEKWNGSGYPHGIAGPAIPIAGRITALADVFDALGARRSYKEPWPLDRILTLLQEERGQHFDPDLVDLLFANLDQFTEIMRQHPDEPRTEH